MPYAPIVIAVVAESYESEANIIIIQACNFPKKIK